MEGAKVFWDEWSPGVVAVVDLSIVVINRNGERIIRYTLGLLLKLLGCRNDIELIVVDDCSVDESVNVIQGLIEKSCLRYKRLVALRRRVGPVMARNLGAAVSRGDILLFMDNDTVVTENIFDKIIAVFRENRDVVMLQPMIEPFTEYSSSWGGGGYLTPSVYGYIDEGCRGEPFYPLGAALAIRREVFFAVGGFTPEYEYMHEEASLAWKARRYTGGKVLCIPEIRVRHIGRRSGSPRTSMLIAHNRVLLAIENHDGLDSAVFSALVAFKQFMKNPSLVPRIFTRLVTTLPGILRRKRMTSYRRYSNCTVFNEFRDVVREELQHMMRKSRIAYTLTLWAYNASSLKCLLAGIDTA